MVNVLKALSDETRLRILNLLYEKELCVCDLEESLGILQTKVSRHLGYLKKAGLIESRKKAQWVYYSIAKNPDTEFINDLILKNLRNNEIYKMDLSNLAVWFKKKYIDC
ncbi:ArsR/SmtB family transcription factor [Sinanaerobacter chloroacetimidivorans]|uniref:ArsR/SmtB family transcription factor n=1 Tax=Sinanaerobacter chloroacetimidivorans TaxID=2818044 RepID=UPI001D04DCFE|nr:metalloregulator ArsR/SmtB family transcription factor [Sinanaerobacter chloroacetimidivorans]